MDPAATKKAVVDAYMVLVNLGLEKEAKAFKSATNLVRCSEISSHD